MKSFNKLLLFVLAFAVIGLVTVSAVVPFGAETVTEENSTRAPIADPENHSAIAGNVTELTIVATSVTQTWQGYFGNVSGTIELADSADNIMYNWSLADPEGEVYATTSGTVAWADIACFDLDANHLAVESNFNILTDDVDGLNETFSDTIAHDEFFTNNVQFTENNCSASFIFDDSGIGVDNHFEEVLLTDQSANDQIIFVALIEEVSVDGFDGRDHDFQMLVLEDGHGTDLDTTTYFFYVELE